MDTFKEKQDLEDVFGRGNAPWAVWNGHHGVRNLKGRAWPSSPMDTPATLGMLERKMRLTFGFDPALRADKPGKESCCRCMLRTIISRFAHALAKLAG